MNDISHNSMLLIQAAFTGDTAQVQRLIPLSDPKANDSEALRKAAQKGCFECVKLLAPVSDPQSMQSKALEWAAYIGHLEMLRFLIPLCNPKERNSYSLQMALYRGHIDCVDELVLVSDPIAVFKDWSHIYSQYPEEKFRILEERVAYCQNKLLHKHIHESGKTTTHIKHKKI